MGEAHRPDTEHITSFRRLSRKDVFFMSFESFRADLVSRLVSRLPGDHLQTVLSVMDEMASSWEFSTKSTAIITADGLPDAVRLYIASKSIENLKKGTLENYLHILRVFFATVRRPIDEVTASDVRLFLSWYKQTFQICNNTYKNKRIMLNSFFEWCVDEDLIRKNPMRHIKPIRTEDPERLPMTAIELEKVRNACASLREKAVVDFLYSTAARVSEFCALNISDVDFAEHTVHIRCGKGGKGRTTFMNAEAEISLRAYLASRTDDCPSLFVASRGPAHRLSKKSIEVEITKIVSRCELSVKVTPHVFRHTAASLALQRGMPIDQVQKWLGHARIQTTLRYAKTLNFDVKVSHQKYVA